MQSEEFLKFVRIRGELHNNDEAKNAIHAVFETLRDRIVFDTSENVKAQLPHEMQKLWETGMMERISQKATGPTRMDLNSFIGRIMDRMGSDDWNHAQNVARAVFMTLRQSITPGAQQEIEREFPADIRDFWLSSVPPEMPSEASTMRTEEGRRRAEVGMGGQPIETEPQMMQEPAAHPPAEERVDMIHPEAISDPNAGPGSATHYRSDPQLEHEIQQMLEEEDEMEGEQINVFVQAGSATLRGMVHSNEHRQLAGRIAAKALGVGEIYNELEVEE